MDSDELYATLVEIDILLDVMNDYSENALRTPRDSMNAKSQLHFMRIAIKKLNAVVLVADSLVRKAQTTASQMAQKDASPSTNQEVHHD